MACKQHLDLRCVLISDPRGTQGDTRVPGVLDHGDVPYLGRLPSSAGSIQITVLAPCGPHTTIA